jgi:hypothetical protein
VLTQEQIDHFRTFGFLVLPAALDGEALGGLTEEVDAAIAAAGPRDTDGGGITGRYVPAGDRPVSAGLVRRFRPLAEQLLGREGFPAAAHEIMFFAEACWHVDLGPDAPALKVVVYLETLDARNGALRVLPATHRIPQAELGAQATRSSSICTCGTPRSVNRNQVAEALYGTIAPGLKEAAPLLVVEETECAEYVRLLGCLQDQLYRDALGQFTQDPRLDRAELAAVAGVADGPDQAVPERLLQLFVAPRAVPAPCAR